MAKRVVYTRESEIRGLNLKLWVVIAAIVLVTVGLVLGFVIRSKFSEKEVYRIEINEQAREDFQSRVEDYRREHPKLEIVGNEGSPDIIIDTGKRKGFSFSLIREIPPLQVKAGDEEISVGEGKSYFLLYKEKDRFVSKLENYLKEKPPDITLTACGDIIPGRHVVERMAQHGVYYPFMKIAPYLKGADIVLANLECPLSDRVSPPDTGMSFVAPSNTIEGIKLCGFNILSLANNHSTNFGREVFVDTLNLLKANNIKYVGGGENYREAYGPVFMDVKGVKFAFLDYNAVVGALNATDTQAGVAGIHLWPWFNDDPQDFEMVKGAVRQAREKADVVVVCFHWGAEEVYYPGDSIKKMAHAACDAGADLIIGTHPHSVQSLEYYNGKLIVYSLGNFVFDQMFTTQVREGIILKCIFERADLIEVELIPYKVYDFCQPVVLTGSSGQYLLDHTLKISNLTD